MDQFDVSNKSELTLKGFMAKTFGWMFWGLLLFFASGFVVAMVPAFRNLVLGNIYVPIILFIVVIQFAVIFYFWNILLFFKTCLTFHFFFDIVVACIGQEL